MDLDWLGCTVLCISWQVWLNTSDHKISCSNLCLFSGLRLCQTSGWATWTINWSTRVLDIVVVTGYFPRWSASVRDVLGWGTSEVIGGVSMQWWGIVKVVWETCQGWVGEVEHGQGTSLPAPLLVVDWVYLLSYPWWCRWGMWLTLHRRSWQCLWCTESFIQCPYDLRFTVPHDPTSACNPHPLNNLLCAIICQVMVLPTTKYQLNKNSDASFGAHPCHVPNQVQGQIDPENDDGEPGSFTHLSASLFEELEATRGLSWQYELQQLKFANQRLHKELHTLESMHAVKSASGPVSSSSVRGCMMASPHGQPTMPSSVLNAAISMLPPPLPQTQTQLYYPLMHLTFPPSVSLHCHSLHQQDPPTLDWSSLAGANRHGPNPRKQLWHSKDGLMT